MVLTIDLGSGFFAKFMLTFDLAKFAYFCRTVRYLDQRSTYLDQRSTPFFFEKNHLDQRSPPYREGGDL